MVKSRDNYYVVTGASGGGKSSIIAELKRRGQLCVEEIARKIIQRQVQTGGDATPWQDGIKLRELILSGGIEAFESMEESIQPVFFDRSILDTIASSRYLKVEIPERYFVAAKTYRYNKTVFITPPWKENFINDTERRHGFDVAVGEHQEAILVYAEAGYQLVEVPQLSVVARADFILEHCRRDAG